MPSGSFDTFLTTVGEILSSIRPDAELVVSGDFNVKFNTDHSDTAHFCDTMVSFGLKQTIFEPTRQEACLDNIFVSYDIDLYSVRVADMNVSDHRCQMVECEILGSEDNFVRSRKVCRPITQRGLNFFFDIIDGTSWDFIGENSDADETFECFFGLLESAYLSAFPEKAYSVRSDNADNISWFNDELRSMRDHLNFLGALKSQYNNDEINQEFKNYKRLYKEAIKTAKIRANNNFIDSSSNRSRAVWTVINNNRNRRKQRPKNVNITSNDFNNFFSNVAGTIVQSIPQSDDDPLDFFNKYSLPETFFSFSIFTFNDVRDMFNSLKNTHTRCLWV